MTQPVLIYPLLLITLMQLSLSLRQDPRWRLAQLAQLTLVLLAALGGLYFSDDWRWAPLAWGMFTAFVILPAVCVRQSARDQSAGRWERAARFRHLGGLLMWGRPGQLHRAFAAALARLARGERAVAESMLDVLAARPMPASQSGVVHFWKLSVLAALRDWPAAAAAFDAAGDWHNLRLATHARILAARAVAETGDFARALHHLQFAALSPQSFGRLETELWESRLAVAALAGDAAELERLCAPARAPLRGRRLARLTAYWRGRCALARDDVGAALEQLELASHLSRPAEPSWQQEMARRLAQARQPEMARSKTPTPGAAGLARAGAASLPAAAPAAAHRQEGYVHNQKALRLAERKAALWRALMRLARPEWLTGLLLGVLAVMTAGANLALDASHREWLLLWASNGPETLRDHQWWRLFTALFLHANAAHLALNGAALWAFGPSVVSVLGRWRFLLLFFMAGALGNALSAGFGGYDISIGASGAIFGLIGAFAVGVYRLDLPIYAQIRRRLLGLLGAVLLLDFMVGWSEPRIDNLAHVGGFFAGVALAAGLWPRRRAPAGAGQKRGQCPPPIL